MFAKILAFLISLFLSSLAMVWTLQLCTGRARLPYAQVLLAEALSSVAVLGIFALVDHLFGGDT